MVDPLPTGRGSLKGNSGVNPGQTRCCKFHHTPANLNVTVLKGWEGGPEQKQVRIPAIILFFSFRGLKPGKMSVTIKR